MRTGLLYGFALAACVGAVLAPPAAAQAPGHASAWTVITCDRACLVGYLHRYMDALTHKDPSRAPFARDVVFTENDVAMPVGEGLWGSISGASDTGLEVADPSTGQAAWFGLVQEHGQNAYYAMRLRVAAGRIAEVETVVHRQTGLPAPFGDPAQYAHDPAFAETLTPEQRRPRERLRAVADSYFDTVELNDGTVFAPFDADCQRTENGISTHPRRRRGGGHRPGLRGAVQARHLPDQQAGARTPLSADRRGTRGGGRHRLLRPRQRLRQLPDHRRQDDEDGAEVAQLDLADGGVQGPGQQDLSGRGHLHLRSLFHAQSVGDAAAGR